MIDKIISQIKKIINHDLVHLTDRGNTAIFAALYIARQNNLDKKTVLIPDQGGWLTYKQYPKKLELNIEEPKTDYGLIDLNDLKQKLEKGNINCLIYAQPAGYFAEQDQNAIYTLCKKYNCTVIVDCCGSFGSDLLKPGYSDILVCSFMLWKPVNNLYGGFISIKNKDSLKKGREIFKTLKIDEDQILLLLDKIKNLKKRFSLFFKTVKKIKTDLKNHNIIHKDKTGINVIVKFKDEEEKNNLIDYCKKNNYEYTLCPRYIRVYAKAVSIEVKRL